MKQVRALMEAEHGSKADSNTAQDVLDSVVQWIRGHLCDAYFEQVTKSLVEVNFGPAIARRYTPILSMAKVSAPNIAVDGPAYASMGYEIADEHMQEIDQRFGFKPIKRKKREPVPAAGAESRGFNFSRGLRFDA